MEMKKCSRLRSAVFASEVLEGEMSMTKEQEKTEGIAAVSGGPDSMAMLGMLLEQGIRPVVAHVNYHARPTALRDEELVRAFCEKNGLIFEKRDVQHQPEDGNFQNWARVVRYAFFEELAGKYDCSTLYIGHQKDDCIETWLMQKERGLLPVCYGLPKESRRKNLTIVRPILDLTKKEAEAWCQDHGIAWGLDESNLSDHYRRNQIRHGQVDEMTVEDKEELIRQIRQDNEALQERRKRAKAVLEACRQSSDPKKSCSYMDLLQEEDAWFILDDLISRQTGRHLSARRAREMVSQLRNSPCHFRMPDEEGQIWILERYGNRLTLDREPEEVLVRFGSLDVLKQGIEHRGSREVFLKYKEEKDPLIDCIWLQPEDFPLTLRTARPSDTLKLRYGTKKLQRHFIDRRMNRVQRKQCLVLENARKTIIFASTLGCDVNHFENGTGFCLDFETEENNGMHTAPE